MSHCTIGRHTINNIIYTTNAIYYDRITRHLQTIIQVVYHFIWLMDPHEYTITGRAGYHYYNSNNKWHLLVINMWPGSC